ncbi:MAG: alpha/beta fold hydrolase [Lewinella sp.]
MSIRTRNLLLALTALGVLAFLLVLHFFLPYLIVYPEKRACTATTLPGIETGLFQIEDNLHLAYQTLTPDTVRGTVILLHGKGSCKEAFAHWQLDLASLGVRSVAIDMRRHGESDGDYATYGYFEKQDVVGLVDSLRRSEYGDLPIGILGYSMGAAIALQTLATTDQLDFGIINETFADFPDVTEAYAERLFHGWLPHWITVYSLQRAGEVADFDPTAVSPERAAENITVPILMSHGEKDTNIPVAHAHRNFGHLASTDKTLRIIPDGTHGNYPGPDGEAYDTEVLDFISRQLR